MRIHRTIINHRENKPLIKNCANNIAIYANCGHGIHGKIEPTIANKHNITHTMQINISIYVLFYNKKYSSMI